MRQKDNCPAVHRIILKWVSKLYGVGLIHLAHNMDQRRLLINQLTL